MTDFISPEGLANPFRGRSGVGDFFAPYFTVNFLTYDKEDFAQLEGATNIDVAVDRSGQVVYSDRSDSNAAREVRTSDSAVMNELRAYITSLEVTCPSEVQCTAVITVEPPFYAALPIIDSQEISIFSIMVIEFGYLNSGNGEQIKSEKHFFMVDKPELEMSGTDVTIRIRGADLFGTSSPRREDRINFPRRRYPTDLSILNFIAAKNRMRLDLSLVPETLLQEVGGRVQPVAHPLRASKLKPEISGVVDTVHQDTKDWIFFSRLVRQNNCSFFTLGSKIFIVDLNVARLQQPAYTLRYYQQPQGPRDIPMQSFSTNADTDLFIPAEAAQTKTASVDPDTNECVVETFDPVLSALEEHLSGRSASGTSIQDGRVLVVDNNIQIRPLPTFKDSETGAWITQPFGMNNRAEHGRQPSRRASLIGNTKASCTIPGNPHISPMMVLRVEGVGRVPGGNYLVLQTIHRFSADGYDTEIEMTRDTSTGDRVAGRGETPRTGTNEQRTDNRRGQETNPVSPDDA